MNFNPFRIPRAGLVLSGVLLLAACGGGSSNDSGGPGGPVDIPAPTLSMSLDVKQFKFAWNAASGASQYRLLESLDGRSPGNVIWEGTQTSYAHGVPLYERLDASYTLEACNASGCVRSNEVLAEGTLVDAVGYVKASNPAAWSRFGHTVSLSNDGKTMLVGAQGAGMIYIFTESNGTWSEQQRIDALVPSDPDQPSLNVTLSGNGNVIAAYSENTIHLFERGSGGWQSTSTLPIPPGQFTPFRVPIFLSDDGATLAAGINGDAYLYARGNGGWEAQTTLPGKGDNLALSADGGLLATAAHISNTVEIHARNGNSWSIQSGISQNVGFAPALAFADQGRVLAIGHSEESSSAQGINGNENDNSAYKAGAVFVYVRNGSNWSRQAYIKASNAEGHDRFGYAIDLSADGNLLVVGAYGEDGSATGLNGVQNNASGPANSDGGSAGAAYVFKRQNGTWTQLAYLKPTNTEREEYGRAVAISGNGAIVAVGDDYEASAATGVGGDERDNSAYAAGAVFLY